MKRQAENVFIIFFSILFSLSALLLPAAEKKVPEKGKIIFDFERKVKKGDIFHCFIKLERSLEYLLAISGTEKKLQKYESVSLNFSGTVTAEAVNKSGSMEKITVKISSLSGSVNGSPVSCKNLTGKTLKGDLTLYPVQFTFPDRTPVLSAEQQTLLRAVFPPATENALTDLTGKKRSLFPGEKFPLDLTKYRKELAARKIHSTEKNLSGFCRFDGFFPFRGRRCGRFFMEMKSGKIPGYQFRYRATCYIPEKKEEGPATSIQREAVEFLTRNISPANRFASGGQMTMEAKEEASIVLFPVEKTEEKTYKGGFLDLLNKK